jgi:hypothetical protein
MQAGHFIRFLTPANGESERFHSQDGQKKAAPKS